MRIVACPFVVLFPFLALLAAEEATITNEDESEVVASPVSDNSNAYEGSPNIRALFAWTRPPYGLFTGKQEINLPAGRRSSIVATLVNTHEGPTMPQFTLDLLEGSLHYPGYYDYRIQNFTKQRLRNTLEPGQEGSLFYAFKPAIELAGRPFDLSIIAYYHDEKGVYYAHSLFNQTVNVHEVEEGIDTEMLFLGVLVVAIAIVVLLGIWHWCSSRSTRRRAPQSSSKSEDGATDKAVTNEYVALLESRKTTKLERSAQHVTRRHGKR